MQGSATSKVQTKMDKGITNISRTPAFSLPFCMPKVNLRYIHIFLRKLHKFFILKNCKLNQLPKGKSVERANVVNYFVLLVNCKRKISRNSPITDYIKFRSELEGRRWQPKDYTKFSAVFACLLCWTFFT